MSRFKVRALVSAICLMGTIFYGLVVFSQTPKTMVRLTTNPPISQTIPFEAEAKVQPSPVQLTLQAVDATGQPLENAKIQLQILTPQKNFFFPTDFPLVEGTELLNVEAVAPKGKLQIQQMLPIRGKYQLLVNVTPIIANAFTPIQQTLTLSVPENWVKYRNFGILAVILLVIGIGGGLVLGGQQIQAGEIAPQRVRLLLSGAIIVAIASLLIINISAEVAESHTHKPHSPTQEAVQTVQGIEARILGDVQATVGQPTKLGVRLLNTITGQPAKDVNLSIKTTQSEHNWVAFAYQGTTNADGQLTWQQQFFDGSPHKVEVEVLSQTPATNQALPLRITKIIEVAGVAPPLSVRLIALAYFTSIIVLGLLLGLRLKKQWLYV